jgi:competence protein ComEC
MIDRSLGHRAPLLWLVIPLMAGLGTGKATDASLAWPWLLGAAVFAVVAAIAAWHRPAWFAPAVVLAMAAAGVASFALHRPRLDAWDALPPREAELTVRVERVFGSASTKRLSGLGEIVDAADPLQELIGQRTYFSISLRRAEVAPLRSSVVRLRGLLTPLPRAPAATSFDAYLANAGVDFRLARAFLRETVQPANAYRRFCARAADRLSAILGSGVPPRHARLVAIYRAMLLGEQHELSEDQTQLFRETGTMHVFSISGLHIAAIATGLHALLCLLRLSRVLQFAIGLAALWLYVDVTGCAPSAVRAYVMVALVQASFVFRAPRNAVSALVASALIILLVDPLQLFSASFQMSYGIVAALLLIGLPLAGAWERRLELFRDLPPATWAWHHRLRSVAWRGAIGIGAIGLAASLVSALTGIMFFGLFTPGSFVVNLWLIPASMFAIYFGFVALVCGLVGFTAGVVLANHAAVVLLWSIQAGVAQSVSWPGMWCSAAFRAAWVGPTAFALLLLALIVGYARRWTGWHRGFWAPFAVVALALGLGVIYG